MRQGTAAAAKESGLNSAMRSRGRLFAASILVWVAALAAAQQAPKQQAPPQPVSPDVNSVQPPVDLGPTLDSLNGTVMKLRGATLQIGLQDGGIALFDVATRDRTFYMPGDGDAPVKDITMLGNRVWWVVDGAQFVRTAGRGMTRPFEMDLSDSGLEGPIKRLSVWQEMIVVHADNGIRFIDVEHQKILKPEQVLPPDVAQAANQGTVTTSWKDGAGLFVVIRKYATKQDPKPGEAKDLGMLTAWTAPWRGVYQLLGSYTCDIAEFRDVTNLASTGKGPNLLETTGRFTASIGNVVVTNNGIVALNSNQALTIPFYSNNWVTDKIQTARPPRYAQIAACSDSDMWWVDDNKLVRASLEDGSSDVYTPRAKSRIIGVTADEDGAWVLQEGCVKRIDDDLGKPSFVRYEFGPATEKPEYGGQARLAWVLKNAKSPGGRKLPAKTSLTFVEAALKAAGVAEKKRLKLGKSHSQLISELHYGDIILNGKDASIYVGNGNELTVYNGGLRTQPVALDEDSEIERFFILGGAIPKGARSLPIIDIGPLFPIGVNRPNPALGTDLFVRYDPDSPYDHPFLKVHQELLDIAERWVGTPYRWGGSTMSGTDCSGFVTSVYRELGINLPRHSQTIARAPFGEVVFDQLHFGDVLVYPSPKHVAIYIGDGRTIETTQGAVGYSNVNRRRTAYVRRFLFE